MIKSLINLHIILNFEKLEFNELLICCTTRDLNVALLSSRSKKSRGGLVPMYCKLISKLGFFTNLILHHRPLLSCEFYHKRFVQCNFLY